MNITVNVVCRKDKANKNGTTPIHLRFTRGSKIRCVSTGTAIVPTAWDAQNRRIIIQNEEPQEIQYRIDSLLAEYHKRLKRLEILKQTSRSIIFSKETGGKTTVRQPNILHKQ